MTKLIVNAIGVLEHSQTDLNKPPTPFYFYREGEKYQEIRKYSLCPHFSCRDFASEWLCS
ncbi:MAG TPA: hypothetical protein PKZ60_08675 [Candidatus Saccharicenans sp.]|jgi:hypothetical protein|nr:hypothetical protein [Candidatus Saccharicenans sp.]